jgi:hypothetical protein
VVDLVSSILLLSRAAAALVGGIPERTRAIVRVGQIFSLLKGLVEQRSAAIIQAGPLQLVRLPLQGIKPIVIALSYSVGQVLSLLPAPVPRLGGCLPTDVD